MNPALPDPAEILLRVRQQLILAQVRIMELEDTRDEVASRLETNEKLLQSAQALADQKLDEAANAERTRVDLQKQFAELQRLLHTTNEVLATTQNQLNDAIVKIESQEDASAAREKRIEDLDTEIRRLKSSRSWRWTAWLRGVERTGGRGKP
jgi:chromosome segregation ATPase